MSPACETDKLEARGNMANKNNERNAENQKALTTSTYGATYEIHIKGQLDESWSDWLEGMEVKLLENGQMVLSGNVIDQAALMGILNKLYGLNLTILSMSEIYQKK